MTLKAPFTQSQYSFLNGVSPSHLTFFSIRDPPKVHLTIAWHEKNMSNFAAMQTHYIQ